MPTMPGTHRPSNVPTRREQKQEQDKRRGSARARGYSHRWDKAAATFKVSHPLCLGCQAVGRVTAAELVDHAIPHKGDSKLFWDHDNWQPSCAWHHDRVKQRLEHMFADGQIGKEDLRLDSNAAIELTRHLDPR